MDKVAKIRVVIEVVVEVSHLLSIDRVKTGRQVLIRRVGWILYDGDIDRVQKTAQKDAERHPLQSNLEACLSPDVRQGLKQLAAV